MPTTPSYPGVYIEEVPSAVRSIPGVSTSVTAFVGYTGKGPLNKPVRCFDFAEFERRFGGLHRDSDVSYSVRQFFLNQGSEAWIVRVANGAAKALLTLKDGSGTARLRLTAKSEGGWGNKIRVIVDYKTANPESTFNLLISEHPLEEAPAKVVEEYKNLSMNSFDPRYVVDILNRKSALVDAERLAVTGAAAVSQSGEIAPFPAVWPDLTKRYIGIRVHGLGPFPIALWPGNTPPASLWAAKVNIQGSLAASGVPALQALTVEVLKANGSPVADEPDSNANGRYLQLTGTAAGDAERSSVEVVPAPEGDATAILKWTRPLGARERSGSAGMRPAHSGSITKDLYFVRDADIVKTQVIKATYTPAMGAPVVGEFNLVDAAGPPLNTPTAIAERLKKKFDGLGTAMPEFEDVVVEVVGSRVRFYPSEGSVHAFIKLENKDPAVPAPLVSTVLGLGDATARNTREYTLGRGGAIGMQAATTPGDDGAEGNLADHMGSAASKTGIHALEAVPLFNLLCIPYLNKLGADDHKALFAEADAYCERRRAFFIVDPPVDLNTIEDVEAWIADAPRGKNSAVYWPEVQVHDPLGDGKPRAIGASGVMAGLYARTDVSRGVWKSPAGTEASLKAVQSLKYVMTDKENGVLNPRAVNALRQVPVHGRIAWGARTLYGDTDMASEWNYISVRRLALYIEESLYKGTQWVVFEPNDEPLWSQIRLNVGAFMHNLFRKGAFQGAKPSEAYKVRCDRSTNPQDQVDLGIVTIEVEFAPLKPAEFVIIRISQISPLAPP